MTEARALLEKIRAGTATEEDKNGLASALLRIMHRRIIHLAEEPSRRTIKDRQRENRKHETQRPVMLAGA